MAFLPIAYTIPQYDQVNLKNYWLKAYEPGTVTPKVIATDSTGGTTAARIELDTSGFPITAGSVRFIPFIEGTYDLWAFPTAAEADANDTTNAIQFADDIEGSKPASDASIAIFDTVSAMVADTDLDIGDIVETAGYTTKGDGGDNRYEIVAAASGTDDGGSFIDLATLQAKGLFSGGDINVKQFGAVGDGAADDTTEIAAAITYSDLVNAPLIFSDGIYLLSNKLTLSTAKAINWKGAGRGLTILRWTSGATSGGGIDITFTTIILPPSVTGMTLETQAVATGTALKITGPVVASSTHSGPFVKNIGIKADNEATSQSWDIGMHFVSCWYMDVSSFSIDGHDDDALPPFAQTAGVKIETSNVGRFYNFDIFHVENAILGAGTTKGEGMSFSEFELVGVTNGIVMGSTTLNAPGTNIGPGHINSYETGINLTKHDQTSIHDILLFKTSATDSTWIGINLVDCDSMHVHDNEMHGSTTTTGSTTGIIINGDGSDNSVIHDNRFQGFSGATKVGVLLTNGAGINHIHDNNSDANTTNTVLIDASATKDNILRDNFPTSIQTFTANDATPSVGNALNRHFNTANSSPTTVTTLDDGYTGQIVSILVNDTNTTFQHNGTGFVLEGGVNFVPGNGAIITFRQDTASGLWREMSRRLA